jgi:aryl-alcohol dehydrogenase-like predicted oxidoreductase
MVCIEVSAAILGATAPEQVEMNARASGLEIPEEAVVRMDAILAPVAVT